MARKRTGNRTDDLLTCLPEFGSPEQRLRVCQVLLDNMADGYIVIRHWKLRYVNERLLEMTGYTREALIGRSFIRLVPPSDRPSARRHYREMVRGGRRALRFAAAGLLTSDGRVMPAEVMWHHATIDGTPLTTVLLRDARERRRAEEERRRLAEFQANVLRAASLPIAAVDAAGRFLLFNRAAERLTGYSAEEVVKDGAIWRRAFPDAALRRRIRREALAAMRQGKDIDGFNVPIRTKSGETRLVVWSGAGLRDGNGRIVGGIGVGRDVTAERQAEAAAERRRRQVEALNAVARSVFLADRVEQAIEEVPRILRRLVGAETVSLALVAAPDAPTRLITAGTVPAPARRATTDSGWAEAPWHRRVLRTRRPIVIPDLRRVKRPTPVHEAMIRHGWRSVAYVAVAGRRGAVGVLAFASKTPDFFADDTEFLATIGHEVGLVIEHSLLVKELGERKRHLEAVNAVGRALVGAGNVEAGLNEVPSILCREIGADAVTLWLAGTSDTPPRFRFGGQVPAAVREINIEGGLRTAIWNRRVVRTGKPVIVPDMRRARSRPVLEAYVEAGLRSGVIVPVPGRQGAVGCLSFMSKTPDFFTRDVAFLVTLGREIGQVIEPGLLQQQLAQRERRLQALHAVTRAVILVDPVEAGLRQVPRILRRLVGAETACLFIAENPEEPARPIFDGDLSPAIRAALEEPRHPKALWTRRVMRTGKPVVIDDLRRPRFAREAAGDFAQKGYRSFVSVPVAGRRGIVGTLEFGSHAPAYFTEADVEFLTTVGHEIGLVIEHRLLEQQLQDREERLKALTSQLARAADDERHHIATLLHDDLGQVLSLARIRIDLAARHLADPARAAADLHEASGDIDRVLAGMRDLAGRLEPEVLTEFDLVGTLRKTLAGLAATRRERIVFTARGAGPRLDPDVERALFRIAVEAVHNALRHARARAIRVTVTHRPDRLTLSVRDDGRGFDPDRAAARAVGLGLRLMRDRARGLRAEFAVRSTRGKGTTVRTVVPLGGDRDEHSRAAGRRPSDLSRGAPAHPRGERSRGGRGRGRRRPRSR